MLYFSRWKTALIWLSVLASVVFAAPNLFPKATLEKLPDWLPKTQMTLGLDLQCGSHILLQLDRKSLVDERVASIRDEIRSKLRDARVGYTGLSGSGKTIQVRIRDASGSIDVSDVGGDFIVTDDGSGSIDYDDVRGRVDIPKKRR